jgi:hypothetical protein
VPSSGISSPMINIVVIGCKDTKCFSNIVQFPPYIYS